VGVCENLQYSGAAAAEMGLDSCLKEVELSALAAEESKGKYSVVLLRMVMAFLFEEKQLSCLHNKLL